MFSLVFVVYNLDRLKVDTNDFIGAPKRTKFVSKHRKQLIVATIFNCFFLLICVYLTPKVLFIILVIVLIGIAYTMPLLPNKKRLKDIPFLKSFVVSFDCTITFVVLPVYLKNYSLNYSVCLMCISIFICIFSNVLVSDMRDMEARDKISCITTFPIYFGISKTKKIIYILQVLLLLLLLVSLLFSSVSNNFCIFIFFIGYICLYVTLFNSNRSEKFFSLFVDGDALYFGVVALIQDLLI